MTWEEWQQFLDSIDNYRHKLMMRTIYELGCRVGEFVRIQLHHTDFHRSRVFLPKENTKTGRRRVSHLPRGLVNELKSHLKQRGRMTVREERVMRPEEYLFSPRKDWKSPYSENRLRQIFRHYAVKSGIDREYGQDSRGRRLHELTVHGLRHSHIRRATRAPTRATVWVDGRASALPLFCSLYPSVRKALNWQCASSVCAIVR